MAWCWSREKRATQAATFGPTPGKVERAPITSSRSESRRDRSHSAPPPGFAFSAFTVPIMYLALLIHIKLSIKPPIQHTAYSIITGNNHFVFIFMYSKTKLIKTITTYIGSLHYDEAKIFKLKKAYRFLTLFSSSYQYFQESRHVLKTKESSF